MYTCVCAHVAVDRKGRTEIFSAQRATCTRCKVAWCIAMRTAKDGVHGHTLACDLEAHRQRVHVCRRLGNAKLHRQRARALLHGARVRFIAVRAKEGHDYNLVVLLKLPVRQTCKAGEPQTQGERAKAHRRKRTNGGNTKGGQKTNMARGNGAETCAHARQGCGLLYTAVRYRYTVACTTDDMRARPFTDIRRRACGRSLPPCPPLAYPPPPPWPVLYALYIYSARNL